MTIYQELIGTFDENEAQVGKFDDDGHTLMPLAHVSVNVDFEIQIDQQGHLINAVTVPKEDRVTVIPATIEAAGRANNVAAFPLQDKLKYVAGDFIEYAGAKADRARECHQAYLHELEGWSQSDQAPEIAKAVVTYVSQDKTIADLVANLPDPKLVKQITSGESFVRFSLQDGVVLDGLPWRDPKVFDAWTTYYLPQTQKDFPEVVDYLTGEKMPEAPMVEKNIYPTASSAKLISANDSSGFSYRGMFLDDEFYHVGFASSQKMSHALKWLIQRQGILVDSRVFLVWRRADKQVDQKPSQMMKMLFSSMPRPTGDAGRSLAVAYHDALFKSAKSIDTDGQINILFLDAATTGRMATVYYDLMQTGQFRENLLNWTNGASLGCVWANQEQTFTPTLNQVIDSAYLIGSGGQRFTAIKRRMMTRLVLAVIHGQSVPRDIVQAILRRISRPQAYANETRGKLSGVQLWRQDTRVYAALLRYSSKGSMTMALNQDSTDRSYLFGRLLGLADYFETRARAHQSHESGGGTDRLTTAMRYFSSFAQQPSTTWLRVYSAMTNAYMPKLKHYEFKDLDDTMKAVNGLFEKGALESDAPLTGNVFKGFMDQRAALEAEAVARINQKAGQKDE